MEFSLLHEHINYFGLVWGNSKEMPFLCVKLDQISFSLIEVSIGVEKLELFVFKKPLNFLNGCTGRTDAWLDY
jgi:hypothetical protein